MRYYYIIHPDNTIVKVATDKKRLDCEDCYHAIKCDWVEQIPVRLNNHWYVTIVDEDGKLNNRLHNPLATKMYNDRYDSIVGSVVIAKTIGWGTFTEEQSKQFEKDLNTLNYYPVFYIVNKMEDEV